MPLVLARPSPLALVVGVALAAATAAAAWSGLQRVAPPLDPAARTAARLAVLAQADAAAPPGRVVFLGSSTFERLDAAALHPQALNLGLGGDTVAGLESRLRGYRSPAAAAAIVLNIGMNDLLQGRDVAQVDVDRLLGGLPPTVPLVVVGLPAVRVADAAREARLHEAARQLDTRFMALCERRPPCRWVPHPATATPAGQALLELDGVHLAAGGYLLLGRLLTDALAPPDGGARP
jgi:lysophospholipase L1-like esterase